MSRVDPMDDDEIVSSLHRRGVRLWVENGKLRFQAPRGVLAPTDIDRLRARKPEIVAHLEELEFLGPVSAVARAQKVPITPTQMRWWTYIRDQQSGRSERLAYSAMHAQGPLDLDVVKSALQFVLSRHRILRARFVTSGDEVLHCIDESQTPSFPLLDFSAMPHSLACAELARAGAELVREKVDLSVGPLFAARMFRLSHEEHVIILALEHMITDDVSNSILRKELWTLYSQAAAGQGFSLPPADPQYADYAIWQTRTAAAWRKKCLPYWRQRLYGANGVRLPVEKLAATVDHPGHSVKRIAFGSELTARLRERARLERKLFAVLVLTAYAVAVSHWCDRRDLVVKLISNGRYRSELQDMVGFLASVLHLRIEIGAGDTLYEVLQRVDLEVRGAYEHPDFDRARTIFPACDTELSFNWVPAEPGPELVRSGPGGALTVRSFELDVLWARKFIPVFRDMPTGVVASITYQTDALTPQAIDRLGEAMRLVAERLATEPDVSVRSVLTRLHPISRT